VSDSEDADGSTRTQELSELATGDRAAWLARVYEQVLLPAFPLNELIPLDTLAEQVRQNPPVIKIMALAQDGEMTGAIVGQWYTQCRVLLIAYLAVRMDLRGHGMGTSLIQSAVARWAEELGANLVVAEVEDPAAFTGRPGEDPQGRLRLYHRFGAQRIDTAYIQPELNPGNGRVKGMFLIVGSSGHQTGSRGAHAEIPSDMVADFLTEYYADAEGPGYDDEEFRGLIAMARRRPTLRLYPLIG
jgi:GNAT superfamily N-acetyltransferase